MSRSGRYCTTPRQRVKKNPADDRSAVGTQEMAEAIVEAMQ
jgi:hypothetical protein